MSRFMPLILLMAWLALAATGKALAAETITDATGAEVPLHLNAQHIVSLAPNVTEMICYLGLDDRLAGRSDFCDYPPEVLELPSVGGFIDTSLEAIVALNPDLVVAYQGNSLELIEQLRELNITVLALGEASSLREICTQMQTIASVADTNDQYMESRIAELSAKLAGLTAKANRGFTVFYGYPGELMYTCAPGTHISDLITAAGGTNIVRDSPTRWPQVSAEFVVAADPDYILTGTSCTMDEDASEVQARLLEQLRADKFWSQLAAVKSGRVIVIDSDVLTRPGPRVLQALEQLIAQLEPQDRPASAALEEN
jgi:iron complex transport system substrate-binding protein